jgi:hypothetical protein
MGVLGVVLLVLAVPVASYIGAQHLADHVQVVARVQTNPYEDVADTVVGDTTFTDASLVRQIQDAVNSSPTIPWGAVYACPTAVSKPIYAYTFTFSWRGIVVERVDADTAGCGFLYLHTLGIDADHDFLPEQGWHMLERLTGMPGPYQVSP